MSNKILMIHRFFLQNGGSPPLVRNEHEGLGAPNRFVFKQTYPTGRLMGQWFGPNKDGVSCPISHSRILVSEGALLCCSRYLPVMAMVAQLSEPRPWKSVRPMTALKFTVSMKQLRTRNVHRCLFIPTSFQSRTRNNHHGVPSQCCSSQAFISNTLQ